MCVGGEVLFDYLNRPLTVFGCLEEMSLRLRLWYMLELD